MDTRKKRPPLKGALYGLAAAFLFGSSMPLAKVLLGTVQPFLLAGLFYFGSGIGLAICLLARRLVNNSAIEQAPIRKADWPWLLCAILFGGILAELSLMWGLQTTPASDASLLLNLEGAFSALIAWFVFREHANKQVIAGMLLITCGAMALSIGPNLHIQLTLASTCIIFACLGWAIDNNLTRSISRIDPVVIACLKGVVAGLVNTAIGIANGGAMPAAGTTFIALFVGFLSYGVSLVLFILGLRHVGAARTSAYFNAAPFVGAFASILFLHEPLTAMFAVATLLMLLGLWLHLTEEHAHEHTHQLLEHEHDHTHDEHHQHQHAEGDPPGEPHSHTHVHEPLTHSHSHLQDIHHHHEH